MASFTDSGAVHFSWFVVVPDCEAARPVAAALSDKAHQQVCHASGRPWLLGTWPADGLVVGQAGRAKIAMLGQHATTAEELSVAASRVRTVADLEPLAASIVGSSHLVASIAGSVRVQGTLTGVRRVVTASLGGVRIAADRADVLAGLLNTSVDEKRLAVYLLDPSILYPLSGQPVWYGVELVPTDHYLVLQNDGRDRQVKWWTPPEPVVPMREGAPALRKALSAAVATRVQGRDLVSCDLGGLDSTAICSLAARGDAKVVAYTAQSQDPLADDEYWAYHTVAGLRTVEHHVIPQNQMPLVYHGVRSMDDHLDEPCAAAVDRERWLTIARRAGDRGSHLHLTGFGGDELLYGSLAHLHSLIRTQPLLARQQLRGFAAKYRWPRGPMLRQLWDNSSYAEWFGRIAGSLTAPPPPLQHPLLDWGFEPRLPPWVTSTAVEAVRALIRSEGNDLQPLAERRGQHRELETMRFVSRIARQLDQMAARFGVGLAAPYYDDRVIEAGLAVRPQDRISPWRYKPLILEAMRGIVPEASLARQTKANGTCDEETGLRQNRVELLELWEDSRLARLGLIEVEVLRRMCTGPLPPQLPIGVLYQTVACEMWLRVLDGAPVPTAGTTVSS